MNEIITTHVTYHGRLIPVSELREQSQIKVVVRCKHGDREVRWNRRNNLCYRCCAERGIYNTSPKGRNITWGDRISKAKKGKKFSDEHKKALVEVRKMKFCKRVGIDAVEFTEFPSYSAGRFNLSLIVRSAIINGWDLTKVIISDAELEIFSILGWNLIDFKNHMESLFVSGMSWNNYGYWSWHIDHIKPLSWYRIESIHDDSFKECWALGNLQPLWKKDNFSKSNNYCG